MLIGINMHKQTTLNNNVIGWFYLVTGGPRIPKIAISLKENTVQLCLISGYPKAANSK